MPLNNFQLRILRVLKPLCCKQSVFAGGSVLHQHGWRMSGDQNLFHGSAGDLKIAAARDGAALRASGIEVDVYDLMEGRRQVRISIQRSLLV